MCNNPCWLCGDYEECKIFYKENRCRSCKYDKVDILISPCRDCCGFDYNNRFKDDKYESI